MALVIANRILETATSPGVGAVSLLGAVTGYQSFLSGIGNGNTTYYTIADQSGANWEVGVGTYASTGSVLTRTTPIAGSATTPVNFSTGTQDVFCDYTASTAVLASNNPGTSGQVLTSGGIGVAPSWAAIANTGVLSFSAGTTGLTPSTATTGAITVAGVLNAANGGTGEAGTLTGILYGNGTSAHTVATTAQVLSLIGTLPVANGGTGVTTSTGSGSVVLSAAPSLTGAVTIGTTSDTGTITVGQSTVSQTINISNGATASGSTKTVNIGTGGLTGSTTTMAIGSTFSTTVAANGTWSFSTPLVATNMVQATTSTSGYLTSTDWNTFNGKQAAGSYVTVGGALGTPSSGTLTNCTFPTLNQNTTGNAATATNAANASGNNFFTAGIGVGVENDIGVACNGQNSAYLYNNASAWGLYSGSGGSIISWQRASSLINMGGAVAVSGAITATSYTGAGTGLTGTASSLSIGGNAANVTGIVAQANGGTGVTASGVCRAWVNFNGITTITIYASFNISSVVRNATGNYTINFTTAMADGNYCIVGGPSPAYANNWTASLVNLSVTGGGSWGQLPSNKTSSSVSIFTGNSSLAGLQDMANVSLSFFR